VRGGLERSVPRGTEGNQKWGSGGMSEPLQCVPTGLFLLRWEPFLVRTECVLQNIQDGVSASLQLPV